MAWRIVLQPNGKLARFSDITDDFTAMNMTEAEAIALCKESLSPKEAKEKVKRGLLDEPDPRCDSPPPGKFKRWQECIETIKNVHGPKKLVKIKRAGEKK